MGSIDNELMLDAQDDAQAVAYILQHLPEELKSTFTEDDIYYILDVIEEYFVESGVLDVDTQSDEDVMVDLEALAEYVVAKANKEKMGAFKPEDVMEVAELELDYAESTAQ